MTIMTSQILKFVDSSKIQKINILRKTCYFFFQIKKITLYTDGYYQVLLDSGACMGQSFSRPGLKFFDSLTL